MASFLKPPHMIPASGSSPPARSPPPTSFRPDGSNIVATRRQKETLSPGGESTKLAHRNSRVDLDFEQALASHDTVRLHEGPDISTMGQEAESPIMRDHHPTNNGDHSSLTLSQMLASGVGRDNSRPGSSGRRLKKAHHASNPSTSPIPNPMSPNSATANATTQPSPPDSSRPSLSEYSSVGGSPAPSNQELPDEQGPNVRSAEPNNHSRGQEEVKKRGMFRSAGTASSPDLGNIVRKKKDQCGPPPKAPNLPHQNNDYDDGVYPSTDAPPSSMAGWTATLSGRNRALSKGEGKSPRTLRAKTGTFLSNIFSNSPGTVRERPRAGTGGSSTPSTPHRTRYDRPFEDSPPVPTIPQEHRYGPTNIADMFAPSSTTNDTVRSSKAGRRTSKPLPPIVRPSTADWIKQNHHQHEMSVSPVETDGGMSAAGSSSPHASPQVTSGLLSTPQRRPAEAISRIQANSSGRRRRSMSVGDAEQWNKSLPGASSPSKLSQPARHPSPQQKGSRKLDPSNDKRPASSTSASSGYATARSEVTTGRSEAISPASEAITPLVSPMRETPAAILPSRDWKHALEGWDHQVASLEIKDPATTPNEGNPGSASKVRPRSRTQDPMPIPPRLSLGKPSGATRAGSVGSPPAGFSLPTESSSSSMNLQPRSPSLYATPPSGPPSASSSFSSMQATPTRRGSASPAIPFTGPVIIGTTPASIGHTTTKVTIQRDEPQMTPTNSPKTSTSPSGSASPHSSPITPHSAVYSSQTQRRSSSSHRSSSPQLQPPSALSQAVSGRAGTSLRVSSLRGQARPTINIHGTPSAPSSNAAGVLRSAPSVTSMGQGSPKISLSFTSPSQENLRFAGASTGGSYGGARAHELRMYGMKNPASASEPTLLPLGGVGGNGNGADDSVKTIRLITSGSRLGGAMRNDSNVTENGEALSSTGISSPTSSVKHAFSNASTGTSVGRSSVSRDGSAGTINGSGSLPNLEEMESKAEAIAQRIWEEDETFKSKERFSEWLGQPDALNAVARRYYMDHFDFTNLRLDFAFRRLCAKLFLRAESQALDRILIEFSRRYWEHNSNCILGSASNVHQVVYSLLLLNTDLHVADLAHHMTKQQFIANTLSTLAGPSRTSSSAPTPARSGSPLQDSDSLRKASLDPTSTPILTSGEKGEKSGPPVSIQNATLRIKRSGSVTSWKDSLSREGMKDSVNSTNSGSQGAIGQHSAPLNSPSGVITENSSLNGSTVSFHEIPGRKHTSGQASVTSLPAMGQKAWENDVEVYLKDIYAAIRSSQILQPQGTSGGLSPGSSLGRGTSQRRSGNNLNAMKRNSIRGIPSFINSQQGVNGSTSSIEGRLSPSPSFATSLNDGMTASSSALFAPALGFASNLTNTIIREAQEDDQRSLNSDVSDSTDVSISDEALALLGAPWAKEGVLHRKQYWESTGKRSKNKNWMEVFVVIQKGQMNMFTFGGSSSVGGGSSSGVVGGGNWLSNANSVGEHMLAHSLAHVLPPPGLARRPHCFVLTLASGMGFFFQAGTEELANEWVSTCNYWAARQSKEPLAGGVSNMEYGWSRAEPEALEAAEDYDGPSGNIRGLSMRDSTDNFSLRSGKSRMGTRFDGFSTMRSNPFTDRVYINDWRAPGHSMVASNHDEETQLEALQRQAEKLKSEFKKHNDLRDPMIALYPPKSSNLAKSMINWESRSQYLHTEIVKYEKYVESLKGAMKDRLRRRGEKALERALLSSSEIMPGLNQRSFGFPDEEAILEGQETETEALTPGANRVQFKANPVQNQQHKRDAAEAS